MEEAIEKLGGSSRKGRIPRVKAVGGPGGKVPVPVFRGDKNQGEGAVRPGELLIEGAGFGDAVLSRQPEQARKPFLPGRGKQRKPLPFHQRCCHIRVPPPADRRSAAARCNP